MDEMSEVRPCDDCQGTGSLGGIRCPRCADMPTLGFTPDPTTMQRWCFAHRSVQHRLIPNTCERWELQKSTTGPLCDIDWTAAPVRLATVKDPWKDQT